MIPGWEGVEDLRGAYPQVHWARWALEDIENEWWEADLLARALAIFEPLAFEITNGAVHAGEEYRKMYTALRAERAERMSAWWAPKDEDLARLILRQEGLDPFPA